MIENEKFVDISGSPEVASVAARRCLQVATCGNYLVLFNSHYGFFFADIVNEDHLDAWVVDRRLRKRTSTMTDLILEYYDQEDYVKSFEDGFGCTEMSVVVRRAVGGRSKQKDLCFLMNFMSSVLEGVEDGTCPISKSSLYPVGPRDWLEWERCMQRNSGVHGGAP